MSRVVNVDSTGKRRNQLRRTIAELLRRLSQKSRLDEEARDMLALMVFCLNEIDDGIEQSSLVWEKRNYWVKAEELRQRWRWAKRCATDLQDFLRNDEPGQVTLVIADLLPHFHDVRINRYMRKPELWRGCCRRLLQEDTPAAKARS